MVRKNYRKNYRRNGKPNYWKKARSAIALAQSAYNTAHAVKRLINVEFKYMDTYDEEAIDTTGHIECLNLIAEGDDYINRNGRSVRATQLDFRGFIEFNTDASAEDYQHGTVLIVRDNQQNGTAPTIAELFTTSAWQDFTTPRHWDRFTVMYAKRFCVSSASPVQKVKKHWKLNHKIEFIGTDATNTSMGAGSMYLVLLGDGTTYPPLLNFHARLRFIDN